MPPPLPPPFMIALRAANLTSEQQAKLRDIIQGSRVQTESTVVQLHSIHRQIADKLLSVGKVTEADLAPLAAQAAQLDQRMQQQWLNTALRIRGILTPQQLSKMNNFNLRMSAIHGQIEALMGGTAAGPGGPPPR